MSAVDARRRAGAGNPKHGACVRNRGLYNVWLTMIHRCEDPKRDKYPAYGGRGIRVCAEWHDPNAFIDWAEASGYEPGLQLDRIDNDGPYSPGNCHWVTRKQNSRNTRRSRFLTLLGMTKTVAEWCEEIPISPFTVYSWISRYGEDECRRRVFERLSRIA